MKLTTSILNSALLLITAIAFSPPIHAADAAGTMYARAIGGETPAAPPPKKTAPPPAAPAKDTVAKSPEPAEGDQAAEEGVSKSKIGVGIAIAAGLAALGGGGSSGSTPPPHP